MKYRCRTRLQIIVFSCYYFETSELRLTEQRRSELINRVESIACLPCYRYIDRDINNGTIVIRKRALLRVR